MIGAMTTTSPPPASRAVEIIDALAPLLAQQRRTWAARCQAHGISIVGFQVLAVLEMHGALPMSRLAEEIGVALPNATGIVSRMADRGLIERQSRANDRRVVLIALTERGRQLIGEMEAIRRARTTRLIAELSDAQQERLLGCVRDLHVAARRLAARDESMEQESA
jgi:DNA-binding MarR family transcriptional regulator